MALFKKNKLIKVGSSLGNVETGLDLLGECTERVSTLRPGFTDGIYARLGHKTTKKPGSACRIE